MMDGNKNAINDSIKKHYEQNVLYEWERLSKNKLEFFINTALIESTITSPCLRILDCGGGPGKYAIHFAQQGHKVTLVDISEPNINFAVEKSNNMGCDLEQALVADARNLSMFEDISFDIVLEMGPLYHLLEVEDRIRALLEAHRVLKTNGIIVISFLNRITWPRFVANTEPAKIVAESEKLELLLETGNLYVEEGGILPSCNTFLPSEIKPFVESNGFIVEKIASSQSFLGNLWAGPVQTVGRTWEAWKKLTLKFCDHPDYVGCGEHLICIAKKII